MSKQPLPQDAHWPEGAIFTVGHSTLPIETFIALLKTYGIERLVDIRTVPRSGQNPQFNSDALDCVLSAETIQYVPLLALGGLPARILAMAAGGTRAFAAMPITCKPGSLKTRSQR